MTEKVRGNFLLKAKTEAWDNVPVQPKEATGCAYHDHDDGEVCTSKKVKKELVRFPSFAAELNALSKQLESSPEEELAFDFLSHV